MAKRQTISTEKPPGVERLHVKIAHSGLCSRRAAEKLILDGRVTVNGELIVEMGRQVGEDDVITVDGRAIARAKQYTLLLNKPRGMVTTMHDPLGRPTIVRLLPDLGVQLKPVGRLDMDTEGLLIVTNDGELALRLAHPRFGIEKEYQVTVRGVPEPAVVENLREGIVIEGRRTHPAQVVVVHSDFNRQTTVLRMTIHEGRKRQIRLMCEAVGHPVIELKRTRLGPFRLKGLRKGEARMLGKAEVDALRKSVGL